VPERLFSVVEPLALFITAAITQSIRLHVAPLKYGAVVGSEARQIFSVRYNVHVDSMAHRASYPLGTKVKRPEPETDS
jgi:hypothetical protein